ncbi:MAG: hypothetical protein IJ071_05150 [Ruminococcus sp.]|nr:hypothetical protein [Ruminococcus sp.]
MANEYICDDRNVLEDAEIILSMTDEEFEAYIKSLGKEANTERTALI